MQIIKAPKAKGGDCHRFERLGWGHAAVYTPHLVGNYEISVHWGDHQNVAARAPWTVISADDYKTKVFNQSNSSGWHSLGVYNLDARSWVRVSEGFS